MLNWRNGQSSVSGTFNEEGAYKPELSTKPPKYDQRKKQIIEIEKIFNTEVFDSNVFGLQWKADTKFEQGSFPEYFKEVDGVVVPVLAKDCAKGNGTS